MNVSSKIALALAAGLSLRAASIKPFTQHTLKVCVTSSREPWILAQAESQAGQMFAAIGIHVDWFHDSRHCKTPADDFLPVQLSIDAPEERFPGALAYSHLHGRPQIEIFYDRVRASVDPHRVPELLAHVLAHEITHTLEDLNRHSDAGLMKAHWSQEDLEEMAFKPLPFAPEDVEMIQRALAYPTLAPRAFLGQ